MISAAFGSGRVTVFLKTLPIIFTLQRKATLWVKGQVKGTAHPCLSCSVAKSELEESALTPGGLLKRRHSRTN
jgi:hypothetical protein